MLCGTDLRHTICSDGIKAGIVFTGIDRSRSQSVAGDAGTEHSPNFSSSRNRELEKKNCSTGSPLFCGMWAVVTGAGSGIGAALTRKLLQAGGAMV